MVTTHTMHRSSFIKKLRTQLPAVEPWLKGYRDNLTFEMMRFRQFTEDAIGRGDWQTVRRAFRLLHSAYQTGNRHLRNSVIVSYLEHLPLQGSNGEAAKKLLSHQLAEERKRATVLLRSLPQSPK